MKKLLCGLAATMMLFGVATNVSASGSKSYTTTKGDVYLGDNSDLHCKWEVFWKINGDRLDASMESYDYQKKITVQLGTEGAYTSWIPSSTYKASVTDMGPWGASPYTKFEWK